jgi:hypothetical protein
VTRREWGLYDCLGLGRDLFVEQVEIECEFLCAVDNRHEEKICDLPVKCGCVSFVRRVGE